MKDTVQTLINRIRTTWHTGHRPNTSANDEIWFAGLAVEPTDFSNQLSRLQLSLQREGAPEQYAKVSPPAVMQ